MNDIKRIQIFLTDYQTKDPYLQTLCEDSYDHFTKELGRESKRISNHPFPEEYTGIETINNMNRHDIRTHQTL